MLPTVADGGFRLYVSNLTDKLQKADLRLSLYALFSTYGPVLDVVALMTMKMRGQAHIVYRDIQASTQAMRSLQGFEFFGKEMVRDQSLHERVAFSDLGLEILQRISYAKTKSDTIAKLDGTYRLPMAATAVTTTELQQSIFGAPPSSAIASTGPSASAASLKPPGDAAISNIAEDGGRSPQGVKRGREDESDEEDAPMDEDDDGDAPMEDSSDDD